MRTAFLILLLAVSSAVAVHAQYHGHCGDYRYTIDGIRISSVNETSSSTANSFTIRTYYKVDEKKGYIWFWIEETEAGSNETAKLVSMWTRLSEFGPESFTKNKDNAAEIIVRLKSSQQFFFTTVYTSQKKGPQYEVRNKIFIRFNDEQAASAFAEQLQQYIPKLN